MEASLQQAHPGFRRCCLHPPPLHHCLWCFRNLAATPPPHGGVLQLSQPRPSMRCRDPHPHPSSTG